MKLPADEDIKEFCEKAVEALNNLNFGLKQEIIRNVVEKVIGTKEELRVEGYLPVDNNNYVGLQTIHRNRRVA